MFRKPQSRVITQSPESQFLENRYFKLNKSVEKWRRKEEARIEAKYLEKRMNGATTWQLKPSRSMDHVALI